MLHLPEFPIILLDLLGPGPAGSWSVLHSTAQHRALLPPDRLFPAAARDTLDIKTLHTRSF